jgi:TRAP-type C4-dicarboxylate transport system substrate-binding protein
MAVFMNKDKWNKLSPAIQKTIEEINAEWMIKHGKAWDVADQLGLDFFLSQGGKVISLSDEESKRWAEKAAPVIAGYIEKASKKGVDGQAVVDFIKTNM